MPAKKLSKNDNSSLWGDGGPYSEIRLIEQTRLLDGSVSRVFLVVEASINPFTFEYVLKNRKKFKNDIAIQDLLDHAEYRGQFDGYVVCAGQEELIDKKSFEMVSKYREVLKEQVLKMHKFVIKEFGLRENAPKKSVGVTIADIHSQFDPEVYIWSEKKGVLPVIESIWDKNTEVSSPAGEKNGKFRYFIIFTLSSKNQLNENETAIFAKQLKLSARDFDVDIEDVSGNMGYILLTALIGPDTVPLDFIDTSIKNINVHSKKKLFMKDHYITNISRPSFHEIEGFLRGLRNKNA